MGHRTRHLSLGRPITTKVSNEECALSGCRSVTRALGSQVFKQQYVRTTLSFRLAAHIWCDNQSQTRPVIPTLRTPRFELHQIHVLQALNARGLGFELGRSPGLSQLSRGKELGLRAGSQWPFIPWRCEFSVEWRRESRNPYSQNRNSRSGSVALYILTR
jgi:hypothetical protein